MRFWMKGELVPQNNEAASNLFAHRWLCLTFMGNNSARNQYMLQKGDQNWKWEEGEHISIDWSKEKNGNRAIVMQVINNINERINSPMGTALNLQGHVSIVQETELQLLTFNLQIKDHQVTYSEVITSWSDPITLPAPNQTGSHNTAYSKLTLVQ